MKKYMIYARILGVMVWLLLIGAFLSCADCNKADAFDWKRVTYKWDAVAGIEKYILRFHVTDDKGTISNYDNIATGVTEHTSDAAIGWTYEVLLIPVLPGGTEGAPMFEIINRPGVDPVVDRTLRF